jgi:hypothetical protein
VYQLEIDDHPPIIVSSLEEARFHCEGCQNAEITSIYGESYIYDGYSSFVEPLHNIMVA